MNQKDTIAFLLMMILINDWWERLITMQTYFHCMDRPSIALDRWGITLIPPESLATFQDIVISDYRINSDDHLVELADFTHISHLKKQ